MPKPYPNYFSNMAPGTCHVDKRFNSTILGKNYSSTDVPIPAANTYTISGSRMSGESPGFPRVLSVNNYSYDCTELKYLRGFRRVTRPVPYSHITEDVTEYSGDFGDSTSLAQTWLTVPSTQVSALYSELALKLSEKVRNQIAGWGENIGEGQKSINMIRSRAIQIGKTLGALRHGDFAAAARHLGVSPRNGAGFYSTAFRRDRTKAIADGWLELQYGWIPLVKDVFSTAESFERLYKNKPPRGVSRVSGFREVTEESNTPVQHCIQTTRKHAKVELKLMARYSSTSTPLRTLKELGLTNPALIAWDLLPFSFVADWFLPIGAWLGQLDATLGIHFDVGSQTQCTENTVDIQRSASNTLYAGMIYDENSSASKRMVVINRIGLFTMPVALLPTAKNPFSVTHAANSIALLQQSFHKR